MPSGAALVHRVHRRLGPPVRTDATPRTLRHVRRPMPNHLSVRVALLAWTAFIVVLTLLPLGVVSSGEPAVWVAIVPFDSIGHALHRGLTWATFVSVVGNVAAFVPIGLLAPMG